MKIFRTKIKELIFLVILFSMGAYVKAQISQTNITLHIGDRAPILKYGKWLKGTPTDITGSKIYVIELWATWCGPCIAAMPHLSELAKKYAEEAVFIGANVLEQAKEDGAKNEYSASLPKVESFIKGTQNRMMYNIIFDTEDQDISKSWLFASGQRGIPTTFVVQNNKLIWIGNPLKLGEVLESLVKGDFDIEKQKKISDSATASVNAYLEMTKNSTAKVDSLINEKRITEAINRMDSILENIPQLRYIMAFKKFETLLDFVSEDSAIEFGRKLNKMSEIYPSNLANVILKKGEYSSKVYLFAVECLSQKKSLNALTEEQIALAYFKAGMVEKAVERQEMAIKLAQEHLADPKEAGRITEYTISELEGKLKKYKEKLK